MSTKLQRISELEEDLREVIPTIKSVLPKHLTHERMIKLVVHATEKNPDLLRCSRASLKAAIIEASELGLEPLGVTGEACLIAYGGSVQLMPMYKGLIKLARNSGQLIDIQSEAIYEKDTFKFSWRTEGNKVLDVLTHDPFFPGDRGEITGGWARASLKNGDSPDPVVRQSYLDITKLKKIRDEASPKSKMWQKWPEEAVKKSCIKNMLKQLPQSVELSQAIDLDNRLETDGRYDRPSSVTVESVEIQEPRRKSESSPQESKDTERGKQDRDPNVIPPDCPDGHGEMVCLPTENHTEYPFKTEFYSENKQRWYPAFYRCRQKECKKKFNYKKWVEANA